MIPEFLKHELAMTSLTWCIVKDDRATPASALSRRLLGSVGRTSGTALRLWEVVGVLLFLRRVDVQYDTVLVSDATNVCVDVGSTVRENVAATVLLVDQSRDSDLTSVIVLDSAWCELVSCPTVGVAERRTVAV